MPDWFQPDPEREHFDNSPRDETVPVSGIFDAPAHIAIVNQEWVAFILGAIDRLGYGDVWGGTDLDRENAYHQILELEAMLMSPANYLIPSDTFQIVLNPSGLPTGSFTSALFSVPVGKRYRLTSANIVLFGGSPALMVIRLNHSGKISVLTRDVAPVDGKSVTWSGSFWLYPGDQFMYQTNNASAGGSAIVSASGLVYDEV